MRKNCEFCKLKLLPEEEPTQMIIYDQGEPYFFHYLCYYEYVEFINLMNMGGVARCPPATMLPQ